VRALAEITVARPIDEVFDFVTDVAKMPSWMTGVRAASAIDEEMRPGARFSLDYMGGWRSNELEVVVAEFTPPTIFATQIARGPFAFEGTMTFESAAGGTRVVNSIEAGPDSLATRIAAVLLGWLLSGSMSRRLHRELETLQHSIEDDTSITA
jgi:uncharacterized protein YndB with AHSA1/START domain